MARRARVSLCMIVRDEAERLGACLDAARPFVDEICVVDTGSTDETIAVAESRGARVARIPWPEHFAEARNRSLEMASGDWILVLDADEVLRPEGIEAFEGLVDDPEVLGVHLLVRNDYGDGRVLSCYVMRLFRNDPSHRFRGAIHEQVVHALLATAEERGGRLVDADVVVEHAGYREDVRRDRRKDERNRPLFERAVAERPDDGYLWFKYGDFLRRFEDRDAVLRALRRSCDLVEAMEPLARLRSPYAAEAHALLALEEVGRGDLEIADRVVRRGLELCTPTPMLHWVEGHVALRREEWARAEAAFLACRAFEGRNLHVPPQPGIIGGRAHFGLARARLGSGRREEACRMFLEGAARWPDCGDLQRAAARVEAAAGDPAAALKRLLPQLEREPRDSESWEIGAEALLELGLAARSASFAERAFREASDHGARAAALVRVGECQIALGRPDDARRSFLLAGDEPGARAGLLLLDALEGRETAAPEPSLAARRAALERRLGRCGALDPLESRG